MSWSYTGEAISCTFDGTEFTFADFTGTNEGMTYLVKLVSPATQVTTGGPMPLVEKTDATRQVIYGVAVGIDGDGSLRNNTPTPRRVRVVRNGIVRVSKFGGITLGDIGRSIVTSAGSPGLGGTTSADGVGRATIVGITGTDPTDYWFVD